MKIALHEIDLKTLKRDITLDFSLLLSSFLILLSTAYIFSYNAIAEKEYDSVLLNIAGRQRMLLRQYASEVNQTLVGLATLDLKMAISKKTKVDQTLKLFEKTHKAFVHGGEIITDINGKNTIIIPPQKNREILLHLKHVDEKWQELKRISLLSLRTNTESITHNAYIYQLLDQTNATVFEMDHVVQVMQHDSETRLRQLDHILLTMVAIGFILFFILVYFVYNRIVLPLYSSIRILRDTTKILEIEKIRAEKTNHAKSEFLSHMSHELRTPMNAILGFGQLLKMDSEKLNETQRGNVIEILDAGQHLTDLINDVLDLTKIESGKLEVSMENVHLSDLLHQCIALTSTQANERQIEIIDHVSGHDYIVHADFTRLKQVLINLLSNAIKYNCKHGSITLEAEIINDKYLHINITDTGDGILEKDIAKLFTPFERLNKKHNVEGTGIGLVISKYLIELMGGNIGVNSTPNEGTCFWIELTLARSTFNSEQETNLNE